MYQSIPQHGHIDVVREKGIDLSNSTPLIFHGRLLLPLQRAILVLPYWYVRFQEYSNKNDIVLVPGCIRLQVRCMASNGSGEYDYDLFTIGAGSGGVRAARQSAGKGVQITQFLHNVVYVGSNFSCREVQMSVKLMGLKQGMQFDE